MIHCATYSGTVVRRCPTRSSYSRERACGLLVDIEHLAGLDATLRLLGFDRSAPLRLTNHHLQSIEPHTLRARIDDELCRAGLADSTGGRVELLFFPRILGGFSKRAEMFFCYSAAGHLAAMVFDIQDAFGEPHCLVEPVVERQFGRAYFGTHERRYVIEVRRDSDALSFDIYERSSLGRRLETQFVAERGTLHGALFLALLRQPLVAFLAGPSVALAGLKYLIRRLARRCHEHVQTAAQSLFR